MVTAARWKAAQEYERSYWEAQGRAIATGAAAKLDWYRWRADQLVARLCALGFGDLSSGTARVVEIGCGPIGIVSFFPAHERVGVDPLERFYSTNPVLTRLRNPSVRYLQGVGEAIPCDSARYDLAIIDNCIDHVRDVEAVRRELARVLRVRGILYMTVNCRTRWGFVVHRTLSRLDIDRGHPHTFTSSRARRLLDGRGFRILSFETESASLARLTDLRSPALRGRLKAMLGVSEFPVSLVAQRSDSVPRLS
ncbi:MAG: class I SAM-dependent methyltransferase [Candidatus Eisenbacteria bacterium]|uniref:Class I SAM-dependent methyltransferase n=1 Tax=Eiseniibacteriota bacterium TaxID=2212470 RepID=A0A538SVC9_UNCEI|nr:MAG: class I SAM-dependent methyltransferase [Candidatus Eisenbacteria bacterium]